VVFVGAYCSSSLLRLGQLAEKKKRVGFCMRYAPKGYKRRRRRRLLFLSLVCEEGIHASLRKRGVSGEGEGKRVFLSGTKLRIQGTKRGAL